MKRLSRVCRVLDLAAAPSCCTDDHRCVKDRFTGALALKISCFYRLVTLGRPSTTTTSPTPSSVISLSSSTRLQTSSTSSVTRYLSTYLSSASSTPATTRRANAVLSTNASHPSQLINTTHRIADTVSSYEVDAFGARVKGPSRVAIAVGVVLSILAVTGVFATLFLFLRSRRRRQTYPPDLHSSAPVGRGKVRPGPQRDPGPVEIHAGRFERDWSDPGYLAKGVETGGSADGHRSFRVPRKPPPSLSKTSQILSTPELVSEEQSVEGLASSLTLPSTPAPQKLIVDIDEPDAGDSVSKVTGGSIEAPNGRRHATNPIPIPGVHRQRAESVTSGYVTDSRPVYLRMHSVDRAHAFASSTPDGPGRKPTVFPISPSACFHEPCTPDTHSGLMVPTPGPTPYVGSTPVGRFGRGVPVRTISDVGISQDVKIGCVSDKLPLVYYPGSHEGPISARGSIHSGMTHPMPGDNTHRMRAQSLSYSHPSLKKARSAEAISVRKVGSETPQSAMPSRSRTPIRRPSRKEVPRRLIAEWEMEIGGPNLDGMPDPTALARMLIASQALAWRGDSISSWTNPRPRALCPS